MGQEQVLEALPCCSWDVTMGLIWGTDSDAEMEKREMGGAFLFSCRKPSWCRAMSPHCLGQGWLWGWSLLLSRLRPHQAQGDRDDSP